MAAFSGVVYSPLDMVTSDSDPKFNLFLSRLVAYRDALPRSHPSRPKMTDAGLRDLAASLVDGTVFEIVKELEEIQQLSERALLNRRVKVASSNKARRGELARRQAEEVAGCRHRPHNLPLVRARHAAEAEALERTLAEDVRGADQRIVTELDQLVVEQQSTLQQAAVPFFAVTQDAQEIRLQMCILELIQRLAQTKHTN